MSNTLFKSAYDVLTETNVEQKCHGVALLLEQWQAGELLREKCVTLPDIDIAGRPEKPILQHPKEMPRRKMGTEQGRLAMIHAIAHIEFNAINLAVDAVYRFRDMPDEYYTDWLHVAAEEAYHFSLLTECLSDANAKYGDFPAHNGLWDMAQKTAYDPMVRMALVPRVMEARGLDVTPGIQAKFKAINDTKMLAALDIILRDEIGHVDIGTKWFNYLCDQRTLNREETYFSLLTEHLSGEIRCPLHEEARLDAGFTQQEIDRLKKLCV